MHIQIQLFRSVRIYFEYFHSVISRVCDAESLDTKGPPAEIAFPLHQTISVLQDQSSASFPPLPPPPPHREVFIMLSKALLSF